MVSPVHQSKERAEAPLEWPPFIFWLWFWIVPVAIAGLIILGIEFGA